MDVFTNTEEIVTTAIGEKKKIYKRSISNFFVHLLDCLNKGKHGHMLKYVPNSDNKEFEVIFTNKHYSGWTENDISLFEDSDKYLEEIHGKERSPDSDDCKGRFRARMQKCFAKYVKFIKEEKDKEIKCKRVAKYKILHVPQYSYVEEISRNKRKLRRKSCGKEKEKSKKKKVNDKRSHEIAPLANMSLGGNYNMLPENVCQENSTKIILKDDLKEKDKKDPHFLCLLSVSQSNATAPTPTMNLNILNMWKAPNTLFRNLDANTNLVTLGGYAPSMVQTVGMETVIGNLNASINVPNVEMETVIGNLDASINVPNVGMETVIGNLDASINVPNVGMKTVIGNLDASINVPNVGMKTVIGNLDASINVPNVGMETVIGNLDANTNLVTHGGYAPRMGNLDASINISNVGMETVIGNSDASINVRNVGMETVIGNSDASINAPNVGMETVIENLDDYTNFTFGGFAPTMDMAMETEAIIRNLDAGINVPNVWMGSVIENSDDDTNLDTLDSSFPSLDLNVKNLGMETVIRNSDAYTNMETLGGCFSSVDLNFQNMGMETVIENSDADAIDSIRKLDHWLCNFQPIC